MAKTAETIKGVLGCGIFLVLVGSGLFGVDEVGQWTLFAFGCTWGGLWVTHD